jgi:hypothetical protein
VHCMSLIKAIADWPFLQQAIYSALFSWKWRLSLYRLSNPH